MGLIPRILFFSRWLQLPLYLGLIVAQAVYVWYFMVELAHIVEATFASREAIVKTLIAQTGIHITLLISAIAIAAVDRLLPARPHAPRAAAPAVERATH